MTDHVLIAPDKFKGSLTAPEVVAAVASGVRQRIPDVELREVPVADGGDGTLDAAVAAGYRLVPVDARGPTGEPVRTGYAERGGTAVVELADVSGLGRLPGGRLEPLRASSYGTGQVIAAALENGCHTVVLGLGGSACTDGGAGMVTALGARLLDVDGEPMSPGGAGLERLSTVDLSGLHPGVAGATVVVAVDVDNPLVGERGAAAVYGPQKGATPEQVALLDACLARFADLVGGDPARPGSGAAGGVGFGAMSVLGAQTRPGIGYLLELVGFPEQLAGARVVVTGEGSLDEQTLYGKAPAGVAAAARAAGVPAVAVAGRCLLPRHDRVGDFERVYALTDIEPDPDRCVANAAELLRALARDRVAPDIA